MPDSLDRSLGPNQYATGSVSDICDYARKLIRDTEKLKRVIVIGEVSNCSYYKNGHVYFTLKDEKASVSAVIWSDKKAKALDFQLKDGMQVRVRGSCDFYTLKGQLQINCIQVENAGLGAAMLEYKRIFDKLAKEGLFDEKHKKSIPLLPICVGICSSNTADGCMDIIRTIQRRFPGMNYKVYECKVQGQDAAATVIAAIERAVSENVCDVLLVARGGGAYEDLAAFNDEMLARKIFDCPVPVITGVGHENDYTIVDYVADLRASTPTAAAEKAVPEKSVLIHNLDNLKKRIVNVAANDLKNKTNALKLIRLNRYFSRPVDIIYERAQVLDSFRTALRDSLGNKIKSEQNILRQTERRFSQHNPANRITGEQGKISLIKNRIHNACESDCKNKKNNNNLMREKLNALGPESVLKRGYSVLLSKDGSALTSVDDIKTGDLFDVKMADGTFSGQRV